MLLFTSSCRIKTLIIFVLINSVRMYGAEFARRASPYTHSVNLYKVFKITSYCIIASLVFAFSLDSSIVPEHNGQAHIPTVT